METIYLQLYSLGQYGEQHPMKDNLKEVAAMGYDGVEFAGNNYGGMSADELKAELAANHLGCRSVHLSMDQIVPTLPFLKEIGCEYAIVAMHAFSDMEETLDCARQLNEAAKEAAKYGIKVGYHNHTQEFNKLGDKYMLEVLIENTDPETLYSSWTAAGQPLPVLMLLLSLNSMPTALPQSMSRKTPRSSAPKNPAARKILLPSSWMKWQADHHRRNAQDV